RGKLPDSSWEFQVHWSRNGTCGSAQRSPIQFICRLPAWTSRRSRESNAKFRPQCSPMVAVGWYVRDQYQVSPRLTVNYGVRWEYYPMAYSDIGGARVLDLSNMNVLVGGGSSGIPIDDGVGTGKGLFLPRVGIAYRPMEKTVIRLGCGINADSNNWRFLRNAFPAVTISDFTGLGGNAAAP